jgi:RNA polymerase sigma-70 factor (ECF subfamily)
LRAVEGVDLEGGWKIVVEPTESWQRLIDYLRPFHDQAAATARRLSRSAGDGDDLFQEAVIRAYDKLPSLRDESRFRPWFYSILLSVHRNRSRRGFWRRFLRLDGKDGRPIDVAGEDGATWDEERRGAERVSRALACLTPDQREAVVLFEMDGFSIEEITAIQRVSMSAVKSRLSRARRRLRRHYESLGFSTRGELPEREPAARGATPIFGAVPASGTPKTGGCGNRSGPLSEGGTP